MRVGTTEQPQWTSTRVWLGCLGLGALALVLRVLGEVVPADQSWGHIAHSICLMAPRWLALLTPLVCLRVAWGSGQRLVPALIGLLALPLAGIPQWDGGRPGVKILVANVNAYTGQTEGLSEAVAAIAPDVMVQVEARARTIPGMRSLANNFDRPLSRPSHATAVFCRPELRCESEVTPEIGSARKHMPIGLVRVEQMFCLIALHGPPPVPIDASGLQPYMDRVARAISEGRMSEDWGPCKQGDPVVVAGDMNAVPGSWAARTLDDTGTRDMLGSMGLFAISWPMGGDTLNLPTLQLDHLYAGDLEIDGISLVTLPGADHRGVMGRVSLRTPAGPSE
jgi:endonuclease/exonuclease/phosphatase (EEP) superfamily protein YafD